MSISHQVKAHYPSSLPRRNSSAYFSWYQMLRNRRDHLFMQLSWSIWSLREFHFFYPSKWAWRGKLSRASKRLATLIQLSRLAWGKTCAGVWRLSWRPREAQAALMFRIWYSTQAHYLLWCLPYRSTITLFAIYSPQPQPEATIRSSFHRSQFLY